jgi:uncharacterized membrane protein YhiD involved in acid resistance
VTAGIGIAVGGGWIWPALAGVLLGWLILSEMHWFEQRFGKRSKSRDPSD